MTGAVPGGPGLGAPGVYPSPPPVEGGFTSVRLDVTGFVGVALRGPVDTPTTVASWTDYRRLFGGVEAPDGGGPDRLLPYAVRVFFDQGGALARVTRVVAPGDGDAATARFALRPDADEPFVIEAADEGSWGDRLRIRLELDDGQAFRARPGAVAGARIVPPPGVAPPVGSLLRVRRPDLPPAGTMTWVTDRAFPISDGVRTTVLTVDPPVPDAPRDAGPSAPGAEVTVVTGALVVVDTDPGFARAERIPGLGLHPSHPRHLGTLLARPVPDPDRVEPRPPPSVLVRAGAGWDRPLVPPDGPLPVAAPVHPGADRWDGIDARSFFDDGGADADPRDERARHRGVDAAGRDPDIGLLCVPDLDWAWRGAPVPDEPDPPADPCAACWEPVRTQTYATPPAPPARLDPGVQDDLDELVARQTRAQEVAVLRRSWTLLLDVPARLPAPGVARWRARFDSAFAAAYHPWLGVPRDGDRTRTVAVPPSAFAAGVVAAREMRYGLSWGPANELAVGAVRALATVSDAEHDRLHGLGINVYRDERDGFRLTAARTLTTDPDYRHLSVRRLVTMLELVLARQANWLAFEPNTPDLRGTLADSLRALLRDLHRQGAFTGADEREAYFVHCDERTNPPDAQAAGLLVAEVGVAPSAPLEYLVLRVAQDADGTFTARAGRG